MGNISETQPFLDEAKKAMEEIASAGQELISEKTDMLVHTVEVIYKMHEKIKVMQVQLRTGEKPYDCCEEGINDGWKEALNWVDMMFKTDIKQIHAIVLPDKDDFNPKREDQEMEGEELMEEYGEIE
jgi:hypothetical protein